MKAEARKEEQGADLEVEGSAKTVPVLDFSGGKDAEEGALRVDLDKLLASRLLVQAESGGGKSWMVRYLCEQTFGLLPHVLFDVEGDFHTLRERFGYVLVSATPGEGDLPADPRTARSLCRRLAELGASVILDLFDLEEEDQQEFARAYMGELLSLERSLWTPRLVIVDEAERLAPEKGAAPSKAAVGSLVKRARKRQMGVALAVQRLSDLDKGAAGGLQTKLIGLTTLDTDVRRAGDALGFDRSGRAALQDLPPGHFFGYGPAIPARGVVLVRSGEVLTTHEPGRATATGAASPAPPAPDSLKRVLAELRDLPEVPDEGDLDEDGLRGRIADLEARLRKAEKASDRPSRAAVEKEVRREVEQRHRRELAEESEKARVLERRISTLAAVLGEAAPLAHRLAAALDEAAAAPQTTASGGAEASDEEGTHAETGEESAGGPPGGTQEDYGPSEAARPDEPPSPARRPAALAEVHEEDATKPEKKGDGKRRILGVLADLETLGASPAERPTVAPLAGYSVSGTFRGLLAEMGRDDLLVSDGGAVRLTEKGRSEAGRLHGEYRRPRSLDELHRRWMSRLPAKEAGMLRAIIDRHPDDILREELALASGMTTSGTFRGYVSHLGRLGLVASKAGRVRATERLFPEGLG